MADIQKIAQFVLRAKDEASPTIKAVGETVRRLSNIKTDNQILALSNQVGKLETSLAKARAETSAIGTEFAKAKAAGAAGAAAMSEYGQALGTAQTRTRALKQALADTTGRLHQLRTGAQSSFSAFSKGADALDATSAKQDRLQRELAQTQAAYRQATKDAASYYKAQKSSPGLTNLMRGNAAVEQARGFKAAMREIQTEIVRTNGAAKGSFAAFDRVAVALQNQTTEAIQLAPAIEQSTANAGQNAAAQAKQRQAIDATTAALRRQQAIAQRPVGRAAGGGGLFDDANSSYATRQGRGPLGLRPYEITNLGYQINDVVSGIAMGQPPLQIFAQQFGQIAQIFPAVTSGILKFLPVMGAFTVAVIAPISRITSLSTSIAQFEKQLAISADGAAYSAGRLGLMAQELDDLGISAEDAREAISTMVKAGVVEGQIKSLILVAEDLASVTGQKIPEAAEQMANAFSGGLEGIRELDRELNFLSAAQYEQIAAMFDSGDSAGAYAEALGVLEDRLGSVADKSSGPWGRAISNIGEAWNNFLAYMADTTAISLVIRSLDAMGVALEKVTGLLVDLTDGSNPNVQGPSLEIEVYGASDQELEDQIKAARDALERAVNEKKIGIELDPFFDPTSIDSLISELERELAYLEKARVMPQAERNRAIPDAYETSKPNKTAEEWARQMDAVEKAHVDVLKTTQEQKKAQIDVSRSIEEMLGKMGREVELASMTAEERFIEQGILEAMNIAKQQGVDLDQTALDKLRERLGLLYEAQKLGEADGFASSLGDFSDGIEAAGAMIRQFESFRSTPYWDVNAFRVGFGSDTITTATGEIKKVVEGMVVTVEDSVRDLNRRIRDEFKPRVEAQVGAEKFASFAPMQQAALISIAYNYGELPGRIVDAVRTGTSQEIGEAIKGLGSDNGGINAGRRAKEASAFTSDAELANVERIAEVEKERAETEKERQKAYDERISDMEFELGQAGLAEREAAIAEAVRSAEKERGRKLTAEERADVERLAAATYDAANAERLKGEEGKRLEQEINTLLERQAFLREQIDYAQQSGDVSAAATAEAELAKVNEQLDAATAKALSFWETMGGPEAESAILALQRTQFELGKLDTRFLMTGEQMNEFIANSATNAFTKFAEAIANGENAAESLGIAFRQMAADILLQIGQMIIKQAIFNMISGMFGGKGLGGAIMGGVGKLFHSGGVVGRGSGPSRTINSAAFAGAPRYHEGGIAGLQPGEVPAILKRGEEVLTEDDPRHAANGGGADGGSTIINAIDAPSFVEEALKSARGRKPILNFMRAHSAAVRGALGV